MKPRTLLACIVAACAVKVFAATQLDLFSDEAFYRACARRPQLAYADHPFMAALWAGLGAWLGGETNFGVRLLPLLAGAALPFVVWRHAHQLVGERDARRAAALSLSLPLLTLTTMLMTPDAALLLFGAGLIASFERATRRGSTAAWLLTGACGAAGLASHVRFVLLPAAAALWLVGSRAGRKRLRGPGPWIALLVMATGLLPMLVFNLQNDFEQLGYQLAERHGVGRGAVAWLMHPLEQALVASPLMYAALLAALWGAWAAARRGDEACARAACFATLPMGLYFLLAPFTDARHNFLHWPQLGYLALLPLLPRVLAAAAARGRAWSLAARAAPLLGAALFVLVLADAVIGWPGFAPAGGFSGWNEISSRVREELATEPVDLVVADNYVAAAELEFGLRGTLPVVALDHPLNVKHGRGLQYELWNLDTAALPERAGQRALVVVELSASHRSVRGGRVDEVRRSFRDVEAVGELHAGGRDFVVLRGVVAGP